jgi:hypothetical protein
MPMHVTSRPPSKPIPLTAEEIETNTEFNRIYNIAFNNYYKNEPAEERRIMSRTYASLYVAHALYPDEEKHIKASKGAESSIDREYINLYKRAFNTYYKDEPEKLRKIMARVYGGTFKSYYNVYTNDIDRHTRADMAAKSSVEDLRNDVTHKKYLKYKTKYLALNKHMIGGVLPGILAADASAASSTSIADLPNEIYLTMFKSLDLKGLMQLRLVNKQYKELVDEYMEKDFIKNKTYLNNLNDIFILCKIPKYRDIIIKNNSITNDVNIQIRQKIRHAINKFEELNRNVGGPFSVVEVFEDQKPLYKIILKVHNIERHQSYYRTSNSRTYIIEISNVGGYDQRGYMATLFTEEVIRGRIDTTENITLPLINADRIFSFLDEKMFNMTNINTLPLLLEKIDNITLEIHMDLNKINEEGMGVVASSSMIEKIL